jgi:epoxyqueuosine reductase
VFGCDVCQEVCPWNDPAPAPDPRLEPYLPELLELDEDGFRARFGGTAIARSKRRGLARNAAVVLGNTGNPAAIEVLEKTLLEHDEAIVRAHAAWALGRLAAEPPLRRALGTEIAPPVRREILGALDEARASAGNDRKSPWI